MLQPTRIGPVQALAFGPTEGRVWRVIEASQRRTPLAVVGLCLGVAVLLAAGCTAHSASSGPSTEPHTALSETPIASNPRCPTTFLHPGRTGFPEFEGASTSSVTLYGLLFASYPVPARHDTKIAWRMTGSGDVRFQALGPQGQHIAPAWGPEPHMSSTWTRPGDEWGTGFRFPVGGCWTIRVVRGDSEATAQLFVASS
jgi:hypothetical protein